MLWWWVWIIDKTAIWILISHLERRILNWNPVSGSNYCSCSQLITVAMSCWVNSFSYWASPSISRNNVFESIYRSFDVQYAWYTDTPKVYLSRSKAMRSEDLESTWRLYLIILLFSEHMTVLFHDSLKNDQVQCLEFFLMTFMFHDCNLHMERLKSIT